MKADLITHYGDDLSPVNAARVSFAKESEWDHTFVEIDGEQIKAVNVGFLQDKDKKLIHYLAKNKHTSCFEHQGATLRLKVPIFIARQIQRHRTFSYNEISRRYTSEKLEFWTTNKFRKQAENNRQGSTDEEIEVIHSSKIHSRVPTEILKGERGTMYKYADAEDSYGWQVDHVMDIHHNRCIALYEELLANGVAREQARVVLPQTMYTEFYMTGNLRNWAHFLKLRLDGHAQLEVQQIAEQVLHILEPLFPVSIKALMEYN